MSADQIAALISAGGWIPIASWIVGLLVRLTKEDTKVPINLPGWSRPWVAVLLGAAQGALAHLALGIPWKQALLGGAFAGGLAVIGHTFGIELFNDGKELPVPFLMKPRGDASEEKK